MDTKNRWLRPGSLSRLAGLMTKSFLFTGLTCLCLLPFDALAEVKTFTKAYTYQAGDFDSRISSRTIALEQVKRLLLEELGTYIASESHIEDFSLTKDQVATYSAGMISAEIVEERWNGVTFYLKAKLTVDPDAHIQSLRKFASSKRQTRQIEEARGKAAKLSQEIEQLKKDLKQTKTDVAEIKSYNTAIKALNAMDWYEKGLVLGRSGDLQGALDAHTKAIEMNPRYKEAYSMRALIYVNLGDSRKATENFKSAARLGDERAQKLLKMKNINW